jgi:hypothetical protein
VRFPPADMTCATPRSNTSRRHYGGPFTRAPRADDGRLVSAGLLARGSSASLPPSRRWPGSGFWGDARRSQLRGQPRHRELPLSPRSLFTSLGPIQSRSRNRHAAPAKQAKPTVVNDLVAGDVGLLLRVDETATASAAPPLFWTGDPGHLNARVRLRCSRVRCSGGACRKRTIAARCMGPGLVPRAPWRALTAPG